MTSKINIEHTSNLIRACKLLGATYKEGHIVLGDTTQVPVVDLGYAWTVNRMRIMKDWKPKSIMIALLEMHLKLIKEKD